MSRPISALSKSESFTPSLRSSRTRSTASGVRLGSCSRRGRKRLMALCTTLPTGTSTRATIRQTGASASMRLNGRADRNSFGRNSPRHSIAKAAPAPHAACAAGSPANTTVESAAEADEYETAARLLPTSSAVIVRERSESAPSTTFARTPPCRAMCSTRPRLTESSPVSVPAQNAAAASASAIAADRSNTLIRCPPRSSRPLRRFPR